MAAAKAKPEYLAFDTLSWHFKYWTFLGVSSEEFAKPYQRNLYRIYRALTYFVVQLYLPFHLVYGLFQLRNPRDIIENMSMSLSMVLCAMKAYILLRTLNVIQDIKEISKDFEQKARKNEGEYAFIIEFKSKTKAFMKIYYVSFTILVAFAAMSILTYDSRRLLYPGYFPYDFKRNRFVYGSTAFLQWFAWSIQAYGNVHHDTYPGILMFLLNQHLKILNLRIQRIGYDSALSPEENHQLLKEAVQDHKQILRFHKIMNDAISKTSFALFLSSSLNIVCCLVLFIFFADNTFQRVYFVQLIFCYGSETALSCYYGSEFETNIFKITDSLYSCNWFEQSKGFKKDFCIFMECSLRKYEFIAGGLVPVSKQTFLRILKGTFSLFTVLNKMREKF